MDHFFGIWPIGITLPEVWLGGGFKHFLFSPLFGEDSHFYEHIFQTGWFNHQLDVDVSLQGEITPTRLPQVEEITMSETGLQLDPSPQYGAPLVILQIIPNVNEQ